MTKYPQTLVNVRVKKMIDLSLDEAILTIVQSVEARLGQDGRVLLRASGTEPVIRVMVEGRDATLTQNYAHEIANVIEASVGRS